MWLPTASSLVRASILSAALAACPALAGCGADPSQVKALYSAYDVTITRDGKSDPAILTLQPGTMETVIFSFNVGVSTDPMSANPTGLRGKREGTAVKIDPQPCHIDHSTGELDGTVSANGSLAIDGSHVLLELSFTPAAGDPPVLAYKVEGKKRP